MEREQVDDKVKMTMVPPDLLQPHLRRISSVEEKKKEQEARPKYVRQSSTRLMKLFKKLPSSTQTVIKRIAFTVVLVSYFIFLIYNGPMFIMLTTLAAQIKCFHEIISIAYRKYDIKDIYTFKYIAIYFLISANIYFGGENVIVYFNLFINQSPFLKGVANYHRFTSFCIYFVGVMWFVLSLKKKHYRKQFSLLAWTHIILLVVVVQSHLLFKTIFQGLIWFIICITTITSNDITAYICGKLFGKTPLIQLSPKKTWEGFIGAAICTVLITSTVSYHLCGSEYFTCPIEYRQVNFEIVQVMHCQPDDMFQLTPYQTIFGTVELYPFLFHSFWLAIFGSLVAPFGGFFASGFKRAFKVKDFGDTIPGHGGIMDRFDCQVVMITFVNVYISSFVSSSSWNKNFLDRLFTRIMEMKASDQLELFYMLKGSLINNGYKV